MKYYCTIILLLSSLIVTGQDSTQINKSLNVTINVSSKNFWRGNVYGDNTPSMSTTFAYKLNDILDIGICGTSPINGSKAGYGIWSEMYVSATIKNFTMVVDDYFFFNETDSLNDWFNWNQQTTQHIIEYRLKYGNEKLNILTSFVVYAGNNSANSIYLEGEFFIIHKTISFLAGGVLGESYLNFYDKIGITHLGINGYYDIIITNKFKLPLKLGAIISPNYKNASELPRFGQNPFNFVVTTNF